MVQAATLRLLDSGRGRTPISNDETFSLWPL
jgi:hypothetical protein